MKKKIVLFLIVILILVIPSTFVIPSAARNLLAQEAPSIFDEGVDTTINPQDIGEDVRQWAQNTALKLKELLKQVKKCDAPNKRRFLIQTIQQSIEEAQGTKELLLMRFALNRALKLEELFHGQEDALAINYVLLPAVKQAIRLYEKADLPYLEANKNKPEGELEPPYYAAFTKVNIGYLLTASNLNKTLEGQFEILKLAVVWIANDLLRSPEARRNSINARIILNLQLLEQSLKEIQAPTQSLNNTIRTTLLESTQQIVSEKKSIPIKPIDPLEKKTALEIVKTTKAQAKTIAQCITAMEVAIDYVETIDDFIELLEPGVPNPVEAYIIEIDRFSEKHVDKFLTLSPTVSDISRIKIVMTRVETSIAFLEACIVAFNSPIHNRADLLKVTEVEITTPSAGYLSKLSELREKYKDKF